MSIQPAKRPTLFIAVANDWAHGPDQLREQAIKLITQATQKHCNIPIQCECPLLYQYLRCICGWQVDQTSQHDMCFFQQRMLIVSEHTNVERIRIKSQIPLFAAWKKNTIIQLMINNGASPPRTIHNPHPTHVKSIRTDGI